MIDEKKLIEDIVNTPTKNQNEVVSYLYGSADRQNEIIDIINAQPKLNEWIPCSERMPEERDSFYVLGCGLDEKMIYGKASKVVNVTVEDEDGTRRVATSFTHKGKWEIEDHSEHFLNSFKVIAWMPLVEIEPYKG